MGKAKKIFVTTGVLTALAATGGLTTFGVVANNNLQKQLQENEELKQTNITIKAENTTLKKDKTTLQNNLTTTQNALDLAETRLLDIETELETSNANIETLTQEKNNLQTELSTQNNQNATLRTALEEVNTELASEKSNNERLQNEKTTLNNQVASLNATINDLNAQIETLNAEIEELEQNSFNYQEELIGTFLIDTPHVPMDQFMFRINENKTVDVQFVTTSNTFDNTFTKTKNSYRTLEYLGDDIVINCSDFEITESNVLDFCWSGVILTISPRVENSKLVFKLSYNKYLPNFEEDEFMTFNISTNKTSFIEDNYYGPY